MGTLPKPAEGERIFKIVSFFLVRYEGGRIEPLEFRWGTRDLQVSSVNAHWVDRATRPINRRSSSLALIHKGIRRSARKRVE